MCESQVNLVLDSEHPSEVKEQALCIVGNIATGAGATDYVMNDDRILHKLLEFMVSVRAQDRRKRVNQPANR